MESDGVRRNMFRKELRRLKKKTNVEINMLNILYTFVPPIRDLN